MLELVELQPNYGEQRKRLLIDFVTGFNCYGLSLFIN